MSVFPEAPPRARASGPFSAASRSPAPAPSSSPAAPAAAAASASERGTAAERRSHPQDRHGPSADRQPRLPRPARGGRRRPAVDEINDSRVPGSPSTSSTATRATPTTRRTRPTIPKLHRARMSPPSIGAASSGVTKLFLDQRRRRGHHQVLAGQHVARLHRPRTTTACTGAPLRRTCSRARCSAT